MKTAGYKIIADLETAELEDLLEEGLSQEQAEKLMDAHTGDFGDGPMIMDGFWVWEWGGFCCEMYRNSYRIVRFYNKSFTFHPKSHTQDPPICACGARVTELVRSGSTLPTPCRGARMRGVVCAS